MVSYIRRILRNIWLFLANLPMERKLIVVFVFLVSIPITYVSYLTSRSMVNSVLVNATEGASQMTSNASDTIDRYVADLKRYTALPLYNMDVQFYLEQKITDWDKNTKLNMFLSYLHHTKEEILAVYLVDRYGTVFHNRDPSINQLFPEEQQTEWKSLTEAAGVAPVIQGRHTIRVNSGEQRDVFSILRTVNSVNTLKKIGIIAFDVDINLFKGIIDPVNAVTQGNTLIVDNKGDLIYDGAVHGEQADKKLSLNTQQLLKKATQPEGHFQMDLEGQSFLVVYTISKQTGWTTLVAIPQDRILSPVQKNRNTLLFTTLIIVAFALFVATVISHALTKPLKSMVRLMKQVQHGNLDVWLHPKYNDEIGMLGSHFNRMIIRVKDLLQEVSVTEKRKQKADMRALQNQINPHFIYNTLESIRMLAESNDDPRVAKLTYLLGLQMRYSITRSDETVTVKHELEHVKNYFHLLQIRFPDKFKLEIEVPEVFLSLPIIKLVFQPIVENAVFHGLDQKEGPGTLMISAKFEGSHAVFCVEDNGVGMDENTLISLNNSLMDGATGEKFGIGLRNVNERIRLHYGSAFGLRVESELGIGTRVILRIEDPSTKASEE
ncbi:sensor histidine kinase [Paenibacillus wynnii]|uniref:Histidine kinase n=1 Tax=Paenibacillus wynnii TaxID=268407 RepID=A0A098MCM5_9BACL|nr:sensor histidine kinase [Paenibacillus wynnii]KGE19302.1 histidine kinase [Paenibacillus wynnii]